MSKKLTTMVVLISALMVLAQTAWGKTIYVDAGATGSNNGTSWANAYVYLQNAISGAVANDEIRVAAGIYRPDQGATVTLGDRNASFILKNLVKIIGGYPAGGGATPDWETNKTILSGDLNGDDNPNTLVQNLLTDATRAENSYHVVYSNLCGSPTLLDGLTITGGQADGADTLDYGGGWYNITNSSPTITNCNFTRNAATTRGGAWYNSGVNCKPTLTNVAFTSNYCADCGGAVAVLNTGTDTKLDKCTLSENRAANYAGSLYLDQSSLTVSACVFSSDYAVNGGSLAGVNASTSTIANTSFIESSAENGGAVWMSNCQITLNQCYLSGNMATNGGACYFSSGQDQLNDCTINNNQSSGAGGAIYLDYAGQQISGCLFYDNATTASQGGAIYNYRGHPYFEACIFVGNYSASHGGAIANQAYGYTVGYWTHYYFPAYLTSKNCLFTGNYVLDSNICGGAIANLHYYWKVSGPGTELYANVYTEFINNTFNNNTALGKGGALYTSYGSSTNAVKNCIFYGNADTAGGNYSESAQIYGGTNTVQYSCIQGLSAYAGSGNIGADPLFVNPLGEDWISGTPDDDLRLQGSSPCIDSGDNDSVPTEVTTDLDGNPRFFDIGAIPDTGNGTAPIVDMGAYERYQEGPFECGDYFHPYPEYDFNHDCTVNLPDFMMFCEEWLTSTAP